MHPLIIQAATFQAKTALGAIAGVPVDIKPRKRAADGAASSIPDDPSKRSGDFGCPYAEAAPILSQQRITAPVVNFHLACDI